MAKVKKSDGLCVDTWKQALSTVDTGGGCAGPYAVDTTNNRRYTFYNGASSQATVSFYITSPSQSPVTTIKFINNNGVRAIMDSALSDCTLYNI